LNSEISDKYKTILKNYSGEIKIQKSRFVSNIFHLAEKENFSFYIDKIKKKYYDAKHHPYAYRLGPDKNNFRFNDDGEPSGSSGKPILDAIDKYELTDVLIVVTRYFGGTKLCVGGLKRAYFDSAEECVKNSKIIEKFICEKIRISFDYAYIGAIMNHLEKNNINIIENKSGINVNILCELRKSQIQQFEENIINLTKGSVLINKIIE
jgi:uncharacterized YigZ family protein